MDKYKNLLDRIASDRRLFIRTFADVAAGDKEAAIRLFHDGFGLLNVDDQRFFIEELADIRDAAGRAWDIAVLGSEQK